MKIIAVADLHGHLPQIDPCDLLIIAGDICPFKSHNLDHQANWLNTTFRKWLDTIPATNTIVISGNHDLIFQDRPDQIPSDLKWIYLQDSGCVIDNCNIWGTPWQPWFYNWAFNLLEDKLCKKWELIPDNTDILVVHGPPKNYGDLAPKISSKILHGKPHEIEYEHTGSISLTKKIKEIKPKLVVCGHIHEGYGVYHIDETIIANVSLMNENYQPVNQIMNFYL